MSSTFAGATWRGAMPLGIWALHFSACYVGIAVGCNAGWQRSTWLGVPSLQASLALLTLLALSAAGALVWQACRDAAGSRALLPAVRALTALLTLVGIAWSSVPLWLLPLCRYN